MKARMRIAVFLLTCVLGLTFIGSQSDASIAFGLRGVLNPDREDEFTGEGSIYLPLLHGFSANLAFGLSATSMEEFKDHPLDRYRTLLSLEIDPRLTDFFGLYAGAGYGFYKSTFRTLMCDDPEHDHEPYEYVEEEVTTDFPHVYGGVDLALGERLSFRGGMRWLFPGDEKTFDEADFEYEGGLVFEIGGGGGVPVAPPPPAAPCRYGRMILIYGVSQHWNGTDQRYEVSDKAIQKAHDAAEHFGENANDPSLRIVHAKWRTAKRTAAAAYVLTPDPNGGQRWEGNDRVPIGKPVTHTADGEAIDCYSEVLVIYHGNVQRTKDILKWLQASTKAPIQRLILWSCWGSEKIEKPMLKPIMTTMHKRNARNPNCDCDMEIFTGGDVRPTPEMVEGIKNKSKRKKIMKELAGFATPLGIDENETQMKLTAPELRFRRYTFDGREVQLQEGVESDELFTGVPIRVDPNLSDRGFAKAYLEGKR